MDNYIMAMQHWVQLQVLPSLPALDVIRRATIQYFWSKLSKAQQAEQQAVSLDKLDQLKEVSECTTFEIPPLCQFES
jgi:hypothetical protein